jgi:Envelope integrity protein A
VTKYAVVVGFLFLAVVALAQQQTPSGKVSLESKSIAVGIGVSWGEGVLTYQGKAHPFTVDGLSVVDLGITKASATGNVYNLKQLSDFSGNYVAAQAGAAIGGGAGAVTMRNQHGVVMELTGTGTGVRLTLAAKGMDVQLKQ